MPKPFINLILPTSVPQPLTLGLHASLGLGVTEPMFSDTVFSNLMFSDLVLETFSALSFVSWNDKVKDDGDDNNDNNADDQKDVIRFSG